MRSPLSSLAGRVAALKMEIMKEASPILVGLFTIMFGLHADYAISRTMATIVPAGVGHFSSEPLLVASWRVVSMVLCALIICIGFVHSAILVIKMRLDGSMIAIYLKVFFTFYLSMSPWITLHLARLVAAPVVREFSVEVDVVFVSMYAAGYMVLWILVGLTNRASKGSSRAERVTS